MPSLKEYKRKRDFKKTPEPSGSEATGLGGTRFVVQKHAATRLHYDFRLELDGTLKSWAVPKGPNFDPSVKALAVQVEDHPLAYASFEGVIPKGQYGGGTVMVCDQGTWEPEEDPRKGLRKGRLKFTLFGEKLKGNWALVRMGGDASDGGKNWLLVKHKDSKAREGYDVTAKKAKSVISGRKLEQIAADADRVWTSKGEAKPPKRKAARAAVKKKSRSTKERATKSRKSKKAPKAKAKKKSGRPIIAASDIEAVPQVRSGSPPATFKAQLATLVADVPQGDDWLHELKFDGYRLLAFIKGDNVQLVTRNGNDWTHRFRTVADKLKELGLEEALLDGEVVALGENGQSDFQRLQNSIMQADDESLVLYLFDLLYLNGFDLTRTPLIERKKVLARLVLTHNLDNEGTIRYSDHILGQGQRVITEACRLAMEGVVSKRADGAYVPGRSRSWLKIKCLKRQEFVIGGYTKPSGSRVGFGALLLSYYQDDRLVYCGRVGTGFTHDSLKQITSELKKRQVDKCPFAGKLAADYRRGALWIKPELVCEVEFSEWTDEGLLRHPSFQGLREDKPARQIIRETPAATARVAAAETEEKIRPAETRHNHARKPARQTVPSHARTTKPRAKATKPPTKTTKRDAEPTVAGVRLTHPDRVLYPGEAVTKLVLAEFYASIADWILPYIVDKPLTLVRCPQGSAGECFYQKHLTDAMPDALAGVMIKEKDKREEYVVVKDLAGLISLVQIGVLEMHPWPARNDQLERPDMLVFDLDPGEEVDWKAVIGGAHDIRDRLGELGLESFVRTTGGKGLHVVAPISRRTNWDDFKAFARAFAVQMVGENSDKYVANMRKALRRGKIFVDYIRNQRGATAIASYSTRARKGAPVATPLRWEELSAKIQPNHFTVMNLQDRLKKLKADPWEGFFNTRQSITQKAMKAVGAEKQ